MPAEEIIFSFAKLGLDNPLIQAFLIAVVRATAGWIQHAFEDGQITMPELKKYGETIFRILPQALGLAAMGLPSVAALGTDVLVTKLEKIANNEEEK